MHSMSTALPASAYGPTSVLGVRPRNGRIGAGANQDEGRGQGGPVHTVDGGGYPKDVET
jgi:hypothetical protein